MINIRPVSDLRNKYPEIEELVLKEDKEVYLTKNGYGSMVVMSLERYSEIVDDLSLNKILEKKYENVDIDTLIQETEKKIDNPKTKYLSHEEVFSKARRIIDEK